MLSNLAQNRGFNTEKRVYYPGNRRAFSIPQSHETLSTSQILSQYARQSWRFQPADSVKLLIDGEQTFPEMLSAINSAQQTIDLETFILRGDKTGRRFLDALAKAVSRGVLVRVLYDFVGSRLITPEFVRAMLNAGIEVAVFHPLIFLRPSWAVNRRDHRKILVVDGKISFAGGINIADDYAAKFEGGLGWRDTHVKIEGEQIAQVFSAIFNYGWTKATPYELTLSKRLVLKEVFRKKFKISHKIKIGQNLTEQIPNGPAVHVVANKEFRQRRLIHNSYLYAINRAKYYILIENAYFIPDADIRNALARAVKRGVSVAVVLARKSDAQIVAMASRFLYKDLLDSGVRIYELPDRMMHAKTAVIDDSWSVVGSYNFDHRSLFHNLEIAAVIADHELALKLKEQTLKDISQCVEITVHSHKSRPWHERFLEPAAHFIRKWL
jgi:cardiolipin synthase